MVKRPPTRAPSKPSVLLSSSSSQRKPCELLTQRFQFAAAVRPSPHPAPHTTMSTPAQQAVIASHPDAAGGEGAPDMTATGLLPHLTGQTCVPLLALTEVAALVRADGGKPTMKVPVFESPSDSQPLGDQRLTVVQATGLLHPVVYAWVFDQQGRLLLRRRSKVDSVAPDTWEVSATGPVKAGESPEEAVTRLLFDQLAIKSASAGDTASNASTGGASKSNCVVKEVVKVNTPHERELALPGGLQDHELAISYKVVVEHSSAGKAGAGGGNTAAQASDLSPAGAAVTGDGNEGVTAAGGAGGAISETCGSQEGMFLALPEWQQQVSQTPAAFSPLFRAEVEHLKWFG